jgi:hypothetical protein
MSTYLIDAGGVGSGVCLALMYSYDACTRSCKAHERRFGKGQMKMVGKVDGPDQLASCLEKRSGKNTSWLDCGYWGRVTWAWETGFGIRAGREGWRMAT